MRLDFSLGIHVLVASRITSWRHKIPIRCFSFKLRFVMLFLDPKRESSHRSLHLVRDANRCGTSVTTGGSEYFCLSLSLFWAVSPAANSFAPTGNTKPRQMSLNEQVSKVVSCHFLLPKTSNSRVFVPPPHLIFLPGPRTSDNVSAIR